MTDAHWTRLLVAQVIRICRALTGFTKGCEKIVNLKGVPLYFPLIFVCGASQKSYNQ
jgi:hypothetical protein